MNSKEEYIEGWTYSTLTGVDFRNRRFIEQDFSGCTFDGMVIGDCEFIDCTFDHASFNGAHISSSLFKRCNFYDTTFRGAELMYTVVVDGDLSGCDFSGAAVAKGMIEVNWNDQYTDGLRIDGRHVDENTK